jgi:hypothetical protein
MMDTFPPKDNNLDDNAYHKAVRTYVEQPVNNEDDREFIKEEVGNTRRLATPRRHSQNLRTS